MNKGAPKLMAAKGHGGHSLVLTRATATKGLENGLPSVRSLGSLTNSPCSIDKIYTTKIKGGGTNMAAETEIVPFEDVRPAECHIRGGRRRT